MVVLRRRGNGVSERAKRAKRYLIVALVCLVAVYMLADVEELADSDSRNQFERSELKPNPNQLRGMPDKFNNNNEAPVNNNFDPNGPIPGANPNQINPGFNNENNLDPNNNNVNENNFGASNPLQENGMDSGNQINDLFKDEEASRNGETPTGEQNNALIEENESEQNIVSPGDQIDASEGNDETEVNEIEDENEETKNDENIAENVESETDSVTEENEQSEENEANEEESSSNHGQTEISEEDQHTSKDFSQKFAEEEMVKEANDVDANEELLTAIGDIKMDIEEAEEEEVVKESDKVLKKTLHDAEDNMNEVIEQILKDKKYGMSNDALKNMEKEVEDRLEKEINSELNERAEKIAEEKQQEIDVVVIEDRNVYPNPADIQKDAKQMEKFFIQDMGREIEDTAEAIKKTIPQRIENITMEVMEEKTGLHIEEDVLQSTEKTVAEEHEKEVENDDEKVSGNNETSDSHVEKETTVNAETKKTSTSSGTKKKKVGKTSTPKEKKVKKTSDRKEVESVSKAVREEKTVEENGDV